MSNDLDLDAVRRELIDLADRLEKLPPDAYAERLETRERQNELREAVRNSVVAGDLMSADQIVRQIDLLKSKIEAHYANRLSSMSGPSTGLGGGIEPRALHEMNRRMDAAADIEGMKNELRRLGDQLAAFESPGTEGQGRE